VLRVAGIRSVDSDGTHRAVAGHRDREAGVSRAHGAAVAAILAGLMLAPAARAAFPGANGPIAYVSFRSGPPTPYLVDPERSGPRPVGRPGEVAPAWSPDGAALAVATATRFSPREPTQFEILVMRADGSGRNVITSDEAQDFDPTWSPDGERIAYSANVGGNRDIWIVRVDGTDAQRLTRAPADDSLPAWSPDGRFISFTRTRAHDGEIYVVRTDGTGLRNLTKRHGDDEDADWSPDGRHLVYTRYGGGSTADVWVMAADGSGVRPLTRHGANDTQPAWSPDGTRIAFTSNRTNHDDVWTMPARGGRAVDVTPDDASDDSPAWGPLSSVGDVAAVPGLAPARRLTGPSV
jgi:Tol biopolymer transport system component